MVGATLGDIRRYVESRGGGSGEYVLVCGRTGDRPVPAAGLSFETRPVARAAARATEQYRAALRRYDPHAPYYDVIVCQHPVDDPTVEGERDGAGSIETGDSNATSMIDFCHTVAGALFETIAASSHADVEDAIMDTYFDVAESIADPDELCIRLIESTAAELDASLEPDEQLEILLETANRLPPRAGDEDGDPLESTLSCLRSAAVIEAYALEANSPERAEAGSWTVTLDEYAFGRSTDRLVTLPIVLELLRQRPRRPLAVSGARRLDDRPSSSWRVDVTAADATPHGLVHVSEGDGP